MDDNKKIAQLFMVDHYGSCTRLTFKDGRKVTFDPPVLLEAGLKYSVDLDTGDMWQVIGGGHMERIGKARLEN